MGFAMLNELKNRLQQCIKIIAKTGVNSRVVAHFNFRVI